MAASEKKYSFERWRKIDLLDLADKLNIYIATSAKKDDVIKILETYLDSLDSPLDTLEYPELSQYYSSFRDDDYDSDSERSRLRLRPKVENTSGQESDEYENENENQNQNQNENENENVEFLSSLKNIHDNKSFEKSELKDILDNENKEIKQEQNLNKPPCVQKNYINNLFFDDKKSDKTARSFKFNLHEYFIDIVQKTSEYNENIQLHLSNLETVYRIFALVEFMSLLYGIQKVVKRDCQNGHELNVKEHLTMDFTPQLEYTEILIICLMWLISYVGIPILIGCYFNFAREVFDLSVDQMVYNLAKLLVIYFVRSSSFFTNSCNTDYNNSANDFVNFVNNLIGRQQTYLNRFGYYVKIITVSLGNAPFVFTIISSILTIYVYILYVL